MNRGWQNIAVTAGCCLAAVAGYEVHSSSMVDWELSAYGIC
jgi:hypothetical protein